MQQSKLIEESHLVDFYDVEYFGKDENLINHSIDAQTYSVSIGGYDQLLKTISASILNSDIEIIIIKHDEGSFKTVIKVVFRGAEKIGRASCRERVFRAV